ncbi:MAG: hypothetical protein P8P81_04460 [Bacteroidia bacterium]|nr:hypothetical protein [Bacteroidia bacterium]
MQKSYQKAFHATQKSIQLSFSSLRNFSLPLVKHTPALPILRTGIIRSRYMDLAPNPIIVNGI